MVRLTLDGVKGDTGVKMCVSLRVVKGNEHEKILTQCFKKVFCHVVLFWQFWVFLVGIFINTLCRAVSVCTRLFCGIH